VRLYLEKNPSQKRSGGVAQGVGPDFKPQYHTHKHTHTHIHMTNNPTLQVEVLLNRKILILTLGMVLFMLGIGLDFWTYYL
jgi:hypothetical protein